MEQSILTSIKKILMISEDYEHYDLDIIMHINSVFSVLFQLGVGPQDKQFRINDKTAVWDDFLKNNDETIEMVKTYMGLKLKLIFDPPEAGFVTTAYQDMIKEYEWRLNVAVDPKEDYSSYSNTDILDILYKTAVKNGYTGTKEEWLEKFNGEGGGDAKLKDDLEATIGAGGIKIGDTFIKGEELETLWRRLLNPVTQPKITEPSVVLSPSGSVLLETGEERGTTLIIKPNMGSISPAYGTSGKRAGDILGYKVNGEDVVSDIVNVIINETNALFIASVEFGPGEQPKDSAGNDYGVPYAGGFVNSDPIRFEFVNALWANTNDISVVSKLPLVSKSAKSYTFTFPPQTKENPETFDVPASWNVTKVEVYNEFTKNYEDDAREFDISTVTHQDAAGNDVEYRRYTDNRGYRADTRKIKITWA